MGKNIDERALWVIHRPGNQATSVQDPKIRSWPGDNGHKGRGEVEPLLREERKGTRLSSAAGWRRFRKHSVPKSSVFWDISSMNSNICCLPW